VTRWHTLLAIDFDKHAAAVYRANGFADDVVCGPVGDHIDALPDCDVLLGGPPCQSFSVAGAGLGESDGRNGWPDACRAVELKRPRQFLFENVAGMLTAKHIKYFGRVLARLEAAGYRVQWRVLDAVNFGVPQFRERVWIWGIRNDIDARHEWPRATHTWPPPPDDCMFGGNLLPGVTVGEALGITGDYAVRTPRSKGIVRRDHPSTEPSPTVMQPTGGKSGLLMVGAAYICRDNNKSGNQWRDITEPAPTLNTNGLDGITEYRWSDAMLAKHPPASPASPASPAMTVQAKWFKGGAEGLVIYGAGSNLKDRRQVRKLNNEPSPTLGAGNIGSSDNSLFVSERDQGDRIDIRSGVGIKGLFVRRLTPLECARLQSVPDDFIWPEKLTKTAMYRIVGNGWSCGIAKALSAALAAADPLSRTCVDLFCGGGLGACGWHGRAWTYEPRKEGVA
jgi:site-specific DNA-cytosine methylase